MVDSTESFEGLSRELLSSFDYYGAHHLMGMISGNHDNARFMAYAEHDVLFSQDSKAPGWKKHISADNQATFDKMGLLMAFNMTIPGIPVIYYGDEFGMTGANDPDNRRPMRFEGQLNNKEKDLLKIVKKLIELRKSNMPLMYGNFTPKYVTKDIFCYDRLYLGNITLTCLNKSNREQEIMLDKPHSNSYNIISYMNYIVDDVSEN